MAGSVLIVSPDRYEPDARLGIHFIADALTTVFDDVAYVAVGPCRANDRRLPSGSPQWTPAGTVRAVDLRTPGGDHHSLHTVRRWLGWPGQDAGGAGRAAMIRAAAAAADVIIVEAGTPLAWIPRLRRTAPGAELVFLASDLPSGDQGQRLVHFLERHAASIDRIVVTAPSSIEHCSAYAGRVDVMVPGRHPAFDVPKVASPYDGNAPNILAIAPTRFDRAAFHIATTSFPQAVFHLVGAMEETGHGSNVRLHGDLAVHDIVPLLRHATLGLAAMGDESGSARPPRGTSPLDPYPFAHFGIPLICPEDAAGERPLRFGYDPGRSASIRAAVHAGLRVGRTGPSVPAPTWVDTVRDCFARPGSEGRTARARSAYPGAVA